MTFSIDGAIEINKHHQQTFICQTLVFANLITGIHSTGRYNTAFNPFAMEQQLTE